jgi:hypothetical protein
VIITNSEELNLTSGAARKKRAYSVKALHRSCEEGGKLLTSSADAPDLRRIRETPGVPRSGDWGPRPPGRRLGVGEAGGRSPLGPYRLNDTTPSEGVKSEMKKVSVLTQVRFHPHLSRYLPLCWKFLSYLRDKEDIQIIIEGYDERQQDIVESFKPYMHRWKPEYMKARIAKFYLLDEWAKQNPAPLSMLTFTTYHDSIYTRRKRGNGVTIEESWGILKIGFRKASLLIRNKIRQGVSYFWITEPQPESGYPHIHAGYFTEFTEDEKHRLKNHWSRVVKAGDYKHGLDFSFEQNFKNGEVASLRNYLLKYLAKTFVESIPDWSPEELVFNAIAWDKGYRFFGCSRDLSTAMKRKKKDNTSYTWLCTTMHRTNGDMDEDIILRKNPTWINR